MSIRVIRSGALIDGNGGPPLSHGIVVVRDDRVEAVGRPTDLEIPDDADVIDATDKTVMPGLIEAHAHVGGGPKDQKTRPTSIWS